MRSVRRKMRRQIQLWWSPAVGGEPGGIPAWLPEHEQRHCRDIAHPARRREAMTARVLVRSVLSRQVPLGPGAWAISRDALGKPALVPPHPLRFSVAHAEGLVVCAVAWNREVGVDVEPLSRGASLLPLAARVLSPAERHSLDAPGDAPVLQDRLLSTWVLKEALLKGLGVGLTVSPEEVSLDLGPEGPSITHAPQGGDGWQLALLDLEGYRIGLAAGPDSEPLELRVRRADGSHLIESAARSQ